VSQSDRHNPQPHTSQRAGAEGISLSRIASCWFASWQDALGYSRRQCRKRRVELYRESDLLNKFSQRYNATEYEFDLRGNRRWLKEKLAQRFPSPGILGPI
jgi:hypothetical protein